MSLIDDALKRAQAAQEIERGGRPWTPPPLPDPGRTSRSRRRRALFGGAIVVLLGTGVWTWRSAHPGRPTPRAAPTRAPESAVGVPPIVSEVEVAPPPRGSSPPTVARSRGETSAAPGSTVPQGARAASSSPVARPAAATAPRADTRESRPHSSPADEPRGYAGEMPLTGGGKITLDGIVFSEASPVAVLNGQVLPVGGFVEGFTVSKILPDRVELERDGARVVLTVR